MGYGNILSGRWLPIFGGMLVNSATTEHSNLCTYGMFIVKIMLSSLCSCLKSVNTLIPQFKKWRYSLKVDHEIEISNKCPFLTNVRAIIRGHSNMKEYTHTHTHTHTHTRVRKAKHNSTV